MWLGGGMEAIQRNLVESVPFLTAVGVFLLALAVSKLESIRYNTFEALQVLRRIESATSRTNPPPT